MTKLADRRQEELFRRLAEIVEVEQQSKKRAGYGEQVIQGLAKRLTAQSAVVARRSTPRHEQRRGARHDREEADHS